MAIAIELSADVSKFEAAFAQARNTIATQTGAMISSVADVGSAIEQAILGADHALSGLGGSGVPAFDQLENMLAGFGAQIQATSGAMTFWLNALALGLRGFSVEEFVTNVISANHELAQMALSASRLGQTTDQIQSLSYAMKTIGGLDSTAGLKSALDFFQKVNAELHETASGGNAGNITKLFQSNGLAITDAAGKLKSFNDLLGDAALLISNAGSEVDKLQIAKMLGLSQEWIKVLEKGPTTLNDAKTAAREAGAVIDKELVKKAVEFDKWWNNSWSEWTTRGKAAAVEIGASIREFIFGPQDPAGLFDRLQDFQRRRNNVLTSTGQGPEGETILDNAIASTQRQLDAMTSKAKDALASALENQRGRRGDMLIMPGTGTRDDPFGALPAKENFLPGLTITKDKNKDDLPTGKPTNVPGTGGDTSNSTDEVERYTNQLQKQVEVLKAEVSVFGLGNSERVKAIDLAKAEEAARVRGSALTDKERAKIEQLAQAHADETKRLEDLKRAQQAVAEATNYFGSQVIDVFDQMIFQGAKASDVMRNLAESIVKAALQATLLGSGPLAGLFGTKGENGNAGGLFGSLGQALASSFSFGGARAAGGAVDGGKNYLVGENGPEMIRMGSSGTVVPNSVLSSASGGMGSGSPIINVHNYGAEVQTSNSNGPSGPQIDVIIRQVIMKDLDQRGDLSRMLERRGLRRA